MPGDTSHALGVAVAAGVLAAGGYCCGRLARTCHLPRISGYVAWGCIVANTGALRLSSITPLRVLVGPSLGTIAISAGAELRSSFAPVGNGLGLNGEGCHGGHGGVRAMDAVTFTLVLYAATFATTFAALFGACRLVAVPLLGSLGYEEQVAAALLCSGVATARSPASALAVVAELEAAGPFTARCLQVSVMLDTITIFAFPFLISAAQAVTRDTSVHDVLPDVDHIDIIPGEGPAQDKLWFGHSDITALCLPVYRLVMSAALGHGLAAAVAALRSRSIPSWAFRLIVSSLCWWLFSCNQHPDSIGLEFLSWDPMLVCLVLGAGGLRRKTPNIAPLVHFCEDIAQVANLCFFVLAGTSLDLRQLAGAAVPAFGLASARLAGLRLGTAAAASTVGEPNALAASRYWMCFITQAGVSVALATEVRTKFEQSESGFGEHVYAVLLSCITLNQLLGPPLFKRAIVAAGEGGQDKRLGNGSSWSLEAPGGHGAPRSPASMKEAPSGDWSPGFGMRRLGECYVGR